MLGLLFGVVAAAHGFARGVANMFTTLPGFPAIISDDRFLCRLRAVEFVHAHPWMPLALAGAALASLLWLEFRQAPRWAVWTTLVVLSVPCLGYIWVCLKAGSVGLFVMGH